MKKIKFILTMMVVAVALAACNDDDKNNDNEGPDGEEGYIMLTINGTTPNPATTRQAITDPGIDEERIINTIHVYMFNQDGQGSPTIIHFDNTQFTTSPTGVTTLNSPIRTSIKDKWAYIGVNLTQEMIDDIRTVRTNLTDVAFSHTIEELANTTQNGFVMFTPELIVSAAEIRPQADDAVANPVSATLRRLTAKTAVYYNNTIFQGDGQFQEDNVQFAWRRINNWFYYVQRPDYQDPNFQPGQLQPSYDLQPFVLLNTDLPSIERFQYTTENTFNYLDPAIQTNDATCVTLLAYFQPTNYTVETGNPASPWGASPNPNVATPGATASDFWVVTVNNGVAYYFENAATAETFYNAARGGGISIDGVPVVVDDPVYRPRHYVNGACYYNVYLNHNGVTRDEQFRYNVFRNQYYRLALNRLTSPGEPDWNFDDNQPITEYGYVQFSLEVEPWEVIDEGIDM